jgi:hypothetical protein
MTFDTTGFFSELAILAGVGAVTALLFSIVVKDRWLALILGSSVATLLLNLWEFLSFGAIDIPFLVHAFVVSTFTAILMVWIVDSVRRPAASV